MRTLPFALLGLLAACSPERESEADLSAGGPSVVAAPTAPVQAARRTFRAWEASCDNTRSCTLFGFPGPEGAPMGEGWGFVRIERGAAADAAPTVILAAGAWSEGQPETAAMTVTVDGRPAASLQARGAEAPYYTGALGGAEAQPLVSARRNGERLSIALPGIAPGEVSLSGAAAALLWADERQGRTAGGAPGAAPAPVVVGAKAAGGTVAAPAALKANAEVAQCLADHPEPMVDDITGTRLTAELVLWEVPCGAGAYNFTTAFFFGDAAGGGLKPVPLTTFEGEGDTPAHHAVNAGFDAATGRIEGFAKGRGVGDCGVEQAWRWDGRGFPLVHDRTMEQCLGVIVDHWPVLHRAVVR